MNDDDMTICDFCANEVAVEDADDCRPDDTGHCIMCGLKLEDESS